MVFPLFNRLAHFRHVRKAVVGRRDAGNDAGRVVDEPLDDVRRDAEGGEAGRERPAQIVKRPAGHATCLVEIAFSFAVPGHDRRCLPLHMRPRGREDVWAVVDLRI